MAVTPDHRCRPEARERPPETTRTRNLRRQVLSTERCLEAIEVHGLALAGAAAGNLGAPVTCCPGWKVGDLVWHLRRVHYFWASVVDGLLTDPAAVAEIERPSDPATLLADYRRGVEWLTGVLREADQTAPVWTWSHQRDVAFVTRHQVQEAAVHRWDAERAAGQDIAIEADVAADSVDEFLEHSTPSRHPDAAPLGGTVHLEAIDAVGGWLISEGGDLALRVRRGGGPADARLRTTASELLLLLYRRHQLGPGQVEGSAGPLERLLARTNLD